MVNLDETSRVRVLEPADLSRNLMVDYIGEDYISGRLYNLGWYPGVKIETNTVFDPRLPTVTGDVFRIRNASVTQQLDAYEGYPTLYNRFQLPTMLQRHVWVYTYNGPVIPERIIESGDWKLAANPNIMEAT